MSLWMYTPSHSTEDMHSLGIDVDFELVGMDAGTFVTDEPTPAEHLEPSFTAEQLSPALSPTLSPVPSSPDSPEYVLGLPHSLCGSQAAAAADMSAVGVTDEEVGEDLMDYVLGSGAGVEGLSSDTFLLVDSEEWLKDRLPTLSAATSDVPATGPASASASAFAAPPAVKCEPMDIDEAVVALSRGSVVTTVPVSVSAPHHSPRPQTFVVNSKGAKSVLKNNNRSVLISRTATSSASSIIPSNSSSNSSCSNSTLTTTTSATCSSASSISSTSSTTTTTTGSSASTINTFSGSGLRSSFYASKVANNVMWGLGVTKVESCPSVISSHPSWPQRELGSEGDSLESPPLSTTPHSSDEEDDLDLSTFANPVFRHTFEDMFDECNLLANGATADSEELKPSSHWEDFCNFDSKDIVIDEEFQAVPFLEVTGQCLTPSNVKCTVKQENSDKSGIRTQDSSNSYWRKHVWLNDHCYHIAGSFGKAEGKIIKTDNLGVQTPSDSEEEIDVVSLSEKPGALPTNPSARDRQQLQSRVASAITRHPARPAAASPPQPQPAQQHQQTAQPTGVVSQPPSRGSRGRIPVRFTLGERTVGVRIVEAATVEADAPAAPTRGSTGRGRRGGAAGAASANTSGRGKRPRAQYQHRMQHHTGRGRGRRPRAYGDEEPDPMERRSLHNDMERQRRIDLRNLVEDLRKCLPALKDQKRAAKVSILREASKYCRALTAEEESLAREVKALNKRQESLMSTLSTLRRRMAARRM